MLAVVALSYEEEAEITMEERKKDLMELKDDSVVKNNSQLKSINQNNLETSSLNQVSKQKFCSQKKKNKHLENITQSLAQSSVLTPAQSSEMIKCKNLKKHIEASNVQFYENKPKICSNSFECGVQRQSSLDDSGVVDDHDDQDAFQIIESNQEASNNNTNIESLRLTVLPKELMLKNSEENVNKLNKCIYPVLHSKYTSQIVVFGE